MYGQSENPFTYCAGCWIDGTIGPFLFAPPLRYQAWRFFSYQFVHQGSILVHFNRANLNNENSSSGSKV